MESLSLLSPLPRTPSLSPSPSSSSFNLRRRSQFLRAARRSVSNQSNVATASPQINSNWSEFANRVSGEWDGFGAEFSCRGDPVELPEYVVPSAFREWGVQVFDWQTQCPTLAQPSTPNLMYKLIRLLPTVGCEADAATRHSVDEKKINETSSDVGPFAFAYDRSGYYVAVWPDKETSFEIEHCLVHPKNHEIRIRLVQSITMDQTDLILRKIEVFSEQWYGPFRNGEQLGGCAIRESGFASTAAMKESRVLGAWKSTSVIADFIDSTKNSIKDFAGKREETVTRGRTGLVTLPKELWTSIGKKDDGDSWAEAGWMIDDGQAITSRCIFSGDGNLKEIAVGYDSAVQEDA